ncbi:MAG: hypothetical protein OEV55_02855 [candidate division Zixibacteria bacterium]|nr:hypothetical protein [candidate division Zixibacteria bacterium]
MKEKPGCRDKRKKDHFVDYYTCSLGYSRKKRRRIRTLNWITGKEEPDFTLSEQQLRKKLEEEKSKVELEEVVAKAMAKLENVEREFIRYFYFDCLSYEKICVILGKTKDRLERVHRTALEKLKYILKDYVTQRYHLKILPPEKCLICSHPRRKELEYIIDAKRKEETWKKVLQVFKKEFNLEIKTPQSLINHQKKHMPG